MSTVALSPTGTASFPDGGGHWWVYLQYALGLRDLGIRVLWVERCTETSELDQARRLLADFGFADDDVFLYEVHRQEDPSDGADVVWLTGGKRSAETALRRCEVLLNFDYDAAPSVVELAPRSALVDIDPGLMQSWWAKGEISPPDHDFWFTTGETVGTAETIIPHCGVDWIRIRPCVHLPSWPMIHGPGNSRFTTVTSWWGREWLTLGDGSVLDNNKRASFLAYLDLPDRVDADIELAAYFGEHSADSESDGLYDNGSSPITPATTGGDGVDVAALLANGWRLARSRLVAPDPDRYRSYIQASTGEFSCVKASCRLFANAWVSDRTLCYLASGRPVVTEHTGPSEVLDGGNGLLRFDSVDEAAHAIDEVHGNHEHHSHAARQLAEDYFSAAANVGRIVETVTSTSPSTSDQ